MYLKHLRWLMGRDKFTGRGPNHNEGPHLRFDVLGRALGIARIGR
jgi:hypothetical protein